MSLFSILFVALFCLLFVEGGFITLLVSLILGKSKLVSSFNVLFWPFMLPWLAFRVSKQFLPLIQMLQSNPFAVNGDQ
jgi:hypothetical protein